MRVGARANGSDFSAGLTTNHAHVVCALSRRFAPCLARVTRVMNSPTRRSPRRHRAFVFAGLTTGAALAAIVACSTSGNSGGTGGSPAEGSGGAGAAGSGGAPGAGGEPQAGSGGAANGSGGASSGGAASGSGGSTDGSGGVGSGGAPTACDATSAPAITRLGYETIVESNDLTVMVY